MTPDEPEVPSDRQRRLEELGEKYLQTLRQDNAEPIKNWVDANPDLQPELGERLELLKTIFSAREFLAPSPDESTQTDELFSDDSHTDRPSSAFSALASLNLGLVHRFNCPHCGQPVQLVDVPLGEISCGSCGSSVEYNLASHSADQEIPEGTTLGRFEILRTLGRGAFGIVLLAFDPHLNRKVALKVPRQGYFASPDDRRRFLREARNIARLRHPGIVRIYEVQMLDKTPLIVSEYIDGLTLSDRMSNLPMTPRGSVQLMRLICLAVQHAHDHGIIHRDLKPGNIMIDQDGQPFVMDFGLARAEEGDITITVDGTVLGTPAFMSPEQAEGHTHRLDQRSDVYSLGVILYKLLCRELPFSGSKRMLIYQVIHEDPVPPRKFRRELPRDLETITLKAMAKAPEHRYESARAMADDLQRWLSGRAILARPFSLSYRLRRWTQRNPSEAALITIVVFFLTLFSAFYWNRANTFSRLRDETEKARVESQQRLYQRFQHEGLAALEDNRLIRAAYCFSEALLLEDSPANRLRCNLTLDQLPKLSGLFPARAKVRTIGFDDSANRIAYSTDDGGVHVYDLETNRELLNENTGGIAAFDLEFLNQGKRLAFRAGPTEIQIWDIDNRQRMAQIFPDSNIGHITASPDQTKLAVTTSKSITVIDANGEIQHQWDSQEFKLKLIFTQNDQLLLQLLNNPPLTCQTRLYDLQNPALDPIRWDHPLVIRQDLSPDRQTLLLITTLDEPIDNNDGTPPPVQIQLYDLRDGSLIVSSQRSTTRWATLLDSNTALIRSNPHVLQNIDLLSDQRNPHEDIPLHQALDTLVVSADKKLVAFDDNHGLGYIVSLERGIEVSSRLEGLRRGAVFQFDAQSRRLAVEHSDGWLRVWDLAGTAANAQVLRHSERLRTASFIPNSTRCLTVGFEETATIWDHEQESQLAVLKHDSKVMIGKPNFDGSLLVTATDQGVLQLWNSGSGAALGLPLEMADGIRALEFSPDGQYLCAGDTGGKVHCWNVNDVVQTRNSKPLFVAAHDSPISEVLVDPDSQRLFTGDQFGLLRAWDLPAGTPAGRWDLGKSSSSAERRNTTVNLRFLDQTELLAAVGTRIFLLSGNLPEEQLLQDVTNQVMSLDVTTSPQSPAFLTAEMGGVSKLLQFQNDAVSVRSQFRSVHMPEVRHAVFAGQNPWALCCGGTSTSVLPTSDLKHNDGLVQVWDWDEGLPLGPGLAHRQQVNHIQYNEQRQQVLSASSDQTARIWNLKTTNEPAESLNAWIRFHFPANEADSQHGPDRTLTSKTFAAAQKKHSDWSQVTPREITNWLQIKGVPGKPE